MWILGPVKQGDLLTEESGEPGLRQARGLHKAQIGDRRQRNGSAASRRQQPEPPGLDQRGQARRGIGPDLHRLPCRPKPRPVVGHKIGTKRHEHERQRGFARAGRPDDHDPMTGDSHSGAMSDFAGMGRLRRVHGSGHGTEEVRRTT